MSPSIFSMKRRELKGNVARLKFLLQETSGEITDKVRLIIAKIRTLLNELRFMLSAREMKRILGATAVFFGLTAGNQVYSQNFAQGVLNPFMLDSTSFISIPYLVDLDNDGDYDLSVGEFTIGYFYYGASIAYFENIGSNTSPEFKAAVSNPFGIDLSTTYAYNAFHSYADIDGDGDLDLFVGGGYYGTYLFKNNGTASNPSFSNSPSLNPYGLNQDYYSTPLLIDLDNDGDLDFMTSDYYDGIVYYENTGTATSPQFGVRQILPFGLTSFGPVNMLSAGDFDGDGDLDLMIGSYLGNVYYVRNSGSASTPAFAAPITNHSNITPGYLYSFPTAADLDGDGDTDLLVGEYWGGFKYYENLTPHAVLPEESFKVAVYPSVVKDGVNIQTTEHLTEIVIIDSRGVTVRAYDPEERKLTVNGLAAGQYLVKMVSSDGGQVLRKITIR